MDATGPDFIPRRRKQIQLGAPYQWSATFPEAYHRITTWYGAELAHLPPTVARALDLREGAGKRRFGVVALRTGLLQL